MNRVERFSYTLLDSTQGEAGNLPFLPTTLVYRGTQLTANGLVDSGAAVNVMPYCMGIQLGAVWENQKMRLTLSGNLAQVASRAIAVLATIGDFEPMVLGFAWAATDNCP